MPLLDLSKIVNNDVEPGTYEVVLTGAKERTNKDKSGDHLMIEMTIQDEDHEEMNGKKLWTNCSYKENALWKLKQVLVAFDADPDIFDAPLDPEQAAKELYGNKALVEVVENDSGVGPATQVKTVRPLSF